MTSRPLALDESDPRSSHAHDKKYIDIEKDATAFNRMLLKTPFRESSLPFGKANIAPALKADKRPINSCSWQ